jgi:uncharacterized protein (DUF983 family)
MLWRGLRRKCPWCGGRGWFTKWIVKGDRCVDCGYRYERQEGFSLGAVAINTMVTFGLMAAVLVATIVATIPNIPLWPLLIPMVIIAVVVPIVLYPVSYTLWAAIDLTMRPLEPAEEADAMTWLAVNQPERP